MAKSNRKSQTPRKCIGPYQCIRTLGEGSFGKVKLAVHQETGQKVALKIIKYSQFNRLTGEREMQLIQREQTFSRQLKHPNIVQLLDVVELPESNSTCLVMEYVKGGDLFDYINKKGSGLSESTVAKMLSQILSALEYMHSKLIVHRDIKAENLLLDEHHNIKLADFGLCNSMNLGSYMKSRCGSPLYAAPEILNGSYYIGPEVDVWSTGVIFHVMVSASIPWKGNSVSEWTANAMKGNYTPIPKASPECAHILSRMLVVDPKRRATIAELLAHPFLRKYGYGHQPFDTSLTLEELDENIVRKLEHLGFTKEQIVEDILGVKKVSQAYHLCGLLIDEKNGSLPRQDEDDSKKDKSKKLDKEQKKELVEAISRKKKELKEKTKNLNKKKKLHKLQKSHTVVQEEKEVVEMKKIIAEMNKVKRMSRSISEAGVQKKKPLLRFLFRRNSQ